MLPPSPLLVCTVSLHLARVEWVPEVGAGGGEAGAGGDIVVVVVVRVPSRVNSANPHVPV